MKSNGHATNEPRRVRVLVVEDCDRTRSWLIQLLSGLPCEIVAEAKSGQEAIDLHKRHKPELTLMDIQMPSMTGFAANRRIIDNHPDAYVVFVDDEKPNEVIDFVFDSHAVDYVRTDQKVERIIKELAYHVRKCQRPPSPSRHPSSSEEVSDQTEKSSAQRVA